MSWTSQYRQSELFRKVTTIDLTSSDTGKTLNCSMTKMKNIVWICINKSLFDTQVHSLYTLLETHALHYIHAVTQLANHVAEVQSKVIFFSS